MDAGASGPDTGVATRLAHRVDFRIGVVTVRPSLCTVEGLAEEVTAEPRVMQSWSRWRMPTEQCSAAQT